MAFEGSQGFASGNKNSGLSRFMEIYDSPVLVTTAARILKNERPGEPQGLAPRQVTLRNDKEPKK